MDNQSRRSPISPSLAGLALCAAVLSILSGSANQPAGDCDAFIDKAQALREAGDNAAATRWARFGERPCRAEGTRQFWRINLLKAESLSAAGDYAPAMDALAATPPASPPFATLRSRRLNDQAWIHLSLAQFGEAARLSAAAENELLSAEPVNPSNLSDLLMTRLYLYEQTGDLENARQLLDRLREAGGVDAAHLLGTYGSVLDRSGRFEEAARYFESALLQPGLSAPEAAKFQNNLADIYYHLGDLDQSLAAGRKAEPALRRALDRPGLRICLNTIGLVHMDQGELPQAERDLQEARGLAADLKEDSALAEVDNNLTSLAIQRGRWAEAEALNRRAFEIEKDRNDLVSEQYSRIHAARILAGKGQFAAALAALDAIGTRSFDNPNPRIDAEVEYIAIYQHLHDEAAARSHYRKARALSDGVRSRMVKDENKLAWYDSQNALNQEWVRFLMAMGRPEEALESAEASRALLLLERIGKAGLPGGALRDYAAVARAADAALVSYWLMPDVSYVWVVKGGAVQFSKLPGEHAIASLVARYRAFLEDGNDPLAPGNDAGVALRQAILDPVLSLLAGANRVILVPDAQLHALNFEALPVDGHYWIRDVTLTIAPSLNVLTASAPPARHSARRSSILAIGDPTPAGDFPRLPNAARELTDVTRPFRESIVLRGPQATPAAYLSAADGPAYIHFAAHAAALAEQPLDSAVILSDGRLTARDLLRHPIHAELVTISACRSAGVRSYHGEGLVGLAWVFLQTGAHGVIAGLWDANDDATAALMAGLYRGIAQGAAPAAALRRAKLDLIASRTRFDRPYYWAPFQYYLGAGHSNPML